ncbi:MAG: hypothetical protein GY856_02640, partial [bacterium]|nr:hypothetical protein [bacterium]
DDDDHETLAGAAHRLAGSSGVLGGRVLSELAREFEKRAHAGTADAAGLERVEKAFHRLSAALDAYRADDGTGVGPDASVKRTLA